MEKDNKSFTTLPKRMTKKVKIKFKKKDGGEVEIDAKKITTEPVKVKFDEKFKEKIPLFLVYKQEGSIKTESTNEVKDYELYGFLKLFLKRMGRLLEEDIIEREDE